MIEQAPEELQASVTDDGEPAAVPVTTGVAAVDQVLGDLEGLDQRPLEEHVGVFERAHESLRAALDAPPDPPADDLA